MLILDVEQHVFRIIFLFHNNFLTNSIVFCNVFK
ncbi:hypothetical protein CoNPh35_CDS0022 [Staphylococcus phage S-CoN_Ph35]|nr:hypothetical protein CoNPh35_CDS0022 [Staphylococcus phage S-CoN_Ph35]